jgi:chromosome segregation ATPase
MDDLNLGQLAQQIKWMEDGRRKDKAQIATLQEQLVGQARESAESTRRLQELDNALKAMQIMLTRLSNADRVREEFKAEIVGMITRLDDERKKSERETERIRNISIETLQRQINEIKVEIPRIGKIEDELPSRRAEEKRLSELVQRLQPQIDSAAQLMEERTRGVPYLEEGRRQDLKRLLVVEQEYTVHLKKLDMLAGKLQVLEDALGKLPPRFEPLVARLSDHDKQLDDLRAGDFRLQQQVKSFESNINQLRDQVVDYTSVLNRLREQAMINQRAETELNAFQETLRMRVAELSEVERMFEERVKKQFEDFLAEFEKRWGKLEPHIDAHWHEHERLHRSEEERLERIEAAPAPLQEQIMVLRQDHDRFLQTFIEAVMGLVETKSSLPQYAVPPAQSPEDGIGLPGSMLDNRR